MVRFTFFKAYVVRIVKRAEKETKVKLKKNLLVCSYKADVYFGIPCRHQLAIYTKLNCSQDYLSFNQRWLLTNRQPIFNEPLDLEKNDKKIMVISIFYSVNF